MLSSSAMCLVKIEEMARCWSVQHFKLMRTWSKIHGLSSHHCQRTTVYSTDCPSRQKMISGLVCGRCDSSPVRVYSSDEGPETFIPKIELFPHPSESLDVVNSRVTTKLGISSIYNAEFMSSPSHPVCELELNWPETRRFFGSGPCKSLAKSRACLQALDWLYSKGLISKDAEPNFSVIVEPERTVFINLKESHLTKVDNVLRMHQEVVAPVLKPFLENSHHDGDLQSEFKVHPSLRIPFPSSEELENWSKILNEKRKPPRHQTSLPIDSYRDDILESLKINRTVILKGKKGSGKTTRLPQFILDKAIEDGQGAKCNILVVSPEISNSVANFVATECGEKVGESVGYMGEEGTQVHPGRKGGSIFFLSAMQLCNMFHQYPSLHGVSHVILGHNFNMSSNGVVYIAMSLLKKAMMVNKNLQLIITDFNKDVDTFKSYFSSVGKVGDIEVSRRIFPVKMHLLDDLHFKFTRNVKKKNESLHEGIDLELDYNLDLIQEVVFWINRNKPEGSILVFIPSTKYMSLTEEKLGVEESLDIVTISGLAKSKSRKALSLGPKGLKHDLRKKRKVFLYRGLCVENVSYTDVFLDAVYVVDCGIVQGEGRSMLFPASWSTREKKYQWASMNLLLQRRDVAGQFRPGESFHLITKAEFMEMADYIQPYTMLDRLVMACKEACPSTMATNVLKDIPFPPKDSNVCQMVRSLKAASLLSSDEKLTPLYLGVKQLDSMPYPHASAAIQSAILGCLDLTLSVLSFESVPFRVRKTLIAAYDKSSDHLALAKLLHSPSKDKSISHSDLSLFLKAKDLRDRIHLMVRSVMETCHMKNLSVKSNDELVKSILLKSFGFLLVKDHTLPSTAVLANGSSVPVQIEETSVNVKLKDIDSPLLMCMYGNCSNGLPSIYRTSVVTPLSILLFLPSALQVSNVEGDTTLLMCHGTSKVKLALSSEQYQKLKALRKALQDVLDYFVLAEAVLDKPNKHLTVMNTFREVLLECLNDILSCQ